jgi:hypothetical protein
MGKQCVGNIGRRFAAYFVAGSLAGCTGLPGWLDERISDGPQADSAPVTYPDLAELPAPPGPPPSDADFEAIRGELEAARATNQREAENLNREIENDFEFPESSSN